MGRLNKKGDIPTLVLVVGVFLVCALIVFSIVLSVDMFKDNFKVLNYMAAAKSTAEKIKFYENAGQNPTDFMDFIKRDGGDYVISVQTPETQNKVFSMQYRIPTASH